MRRDDSIFLIHNERKTLNIFKMTKTKTAVFLVMVVCSCGLIFSITDAYPTYEPESALNDTKLGNNSRLVITNVVKTIEFEVGLMDDDGNVNENITDSDASEFYETDIQLLNVDLLKAVVDQAKEEEEEEENWEGTSQPELQSNVENGQRMQNVSLLQLNNRTNS